MITSRYAPCTQHVVSIHMYVPIYLLNSSRITLGLLHILFSSVNSQFSGRTHHGMVTILHISNIQIISDHKSIIS